MANYCRICQRKETDKNACKICIHNPILIDCFIEDLKHCPFCGNEAELVEGDNGSYKISCRCCNAEMGWFYNKKDAYEAWNRRF